MLGIAQMLGKNPREFTVRYWYFLKVYVFRLDAYHLNIHTVNSHNYFNSILQNSALLKLSSLDIQFIGVTAGMNSETQI